MDSKPICHPSPVKKMKCLFLDYIQLLMIGRAGWWTETPSTTPLQPKKWNAYFWIMFNFWWSARLLNGLKPHLPPLSSQRMKSSFLDYIQLLMIGRSGWGTQTPSTTPLHPKKWNTHFWITFNFWWLARLVNGLEPHRPPLLSSQKKWNAHFWIAFTSDDRLGWLMNLNPICHSSPAKKWNAHSLIMFKFWWSAWLVNRLKTHLPPLSSQKNEMLLFGLCSLLIISQAGWWTRTPSATPFHPIKWNASFWIAFTSDDQPGWLMDSNPICHPSPANKMKCFFLDYVHFRWSARLVDGLKPYPSPVSSQ